MIAGNLSENNKLEKLLIKGPNYSEPQLIKFSKVFYEIKKAINSCKKQKNCTISKLEGKSVNVS